MQNHKERLSQIGVYTQKRRKDILNYALFCKNVIVLQKIQGDFETKEDGHTKRVSANGVMFAETLFAQHMRSKNISHCLDILPNTSWFYIDGSKDETEYFLHHQCCKCSLPKTEIIGRHCQCMHAHEDL